MSAPWQAHLAFALLAFLVLPAFGQTPHGMRLRLPLLLALGYLPIAGLPLAAYLRGIIDDLAITTLVALAYAALVRMDLLPAPSPSSRGQIVLLFAVLALVLYPATLGLSQFDPYRLGYHPRPLLLVMGALALALLAARNWPGVWMLGLATLAFTLGGKFSGNYWDYLLDPFLALFCWIATLREGGRLAWRRFRTVTD
ncbi:hypothetical protein D3C76_734520 [compost metagenome]